MDKEKLLEQAKREADFKAKMEQLKINYNIPERVELASGKTVKIHRITGAPLDFISKYVVHQVEFETTETAEIIAKMRPNLKLQYKAISIAILNNPAWGGWKGFLNIKLSHWFHWRLLRWKYDPSEMQDILSVVIEKMGVSFFFQNTTLLKQMDSLKKKRTKTEVELLQAERESEK